jgi:hypothetical protein
MWPRCYRKPDSCICSPVSGHSEPYSGVVKSVEKSTWILYFGAFMPFNILGMLIDFHCSILYAVAYSLSSISISNSFIGLQKISLEIHFMSSHLRYSLDRSLWLQESRWEGIRKLMKINDVTRKQQVSPKQSQSALRSIIVLIFPFCWNLRTNHWIVSDV